MRLQGIRTHLRRLSLAPFLLLLIVAGALAFQIARQRLAGLSLTESDQRYARMTHVLKLLVDLETGFRGYLLSGSPNFLEPYRDSVGKIQVELGEFRRSLPPDSDEKDDAERLGNQIQGWIGYSQDWIRRRQADPRVGVSFQDNEGKSRMDAARESASFILASEEAARGRLSARYDREFQMSITSIFALSALSALLIALIARQEARWIIRTFERALDDLQAASQARDDFIALASHELRTPLTSMALQLESIQRKARKADSAPEEYAVKRANLDLFARQTRRVSKLVQTMLDLSRFKEGKLAMNFEEVNVSRLVREVLDDFADPSDPTGCRYSARIANELIAACDPSRLEQVLVNLLSNAKRYGCGGKILVALEERGDWLTLSVTDHGPGIRREDREHIFEKFRRLDPGRSQGGLGLGLFLVHEIVEGHGGTITVESDAERGTTFEVKLPKRQAGASDRAA